MADFRASVNRRPSGEENSHFNNPALTETHPTPIDEPPVPPTHRAAWKEIIRHFSPSWFSVTMGTGVVDVLIQRLPYNARWLHWLSVILFVFNTTLFVLGIIVSAIRYLAWPHIWTIMRRDSHHSLFLGAVPISFTLIINMVIYVCVPAWGEWAAEMAWVMWIIDSVVAVMVTILVPYTIMTHNQRSSLSMFNAIQVMPLSSTIAAAATGSIVAISLPPSQKAVWTMVASYASLGVGLPMVISVLGIYYQRLTLHKLPPRDVLVSVFLPLSPLSLGSFSILRLGVAAATLNPELKALNKYGDAGPILYVIGCIVSLILWAYALIWLAYAVASILHRKYFPFNMGWWGFTFPLGVFAHSTIALGAELSSRFFDVLGTILAVLCIFLWIIVVAGTIKGIITGQMLYTSSVRNAELKEQNRRQSAQDAV